MLDYLLKIIDYMVTFFKGINPMTVIVPVLAVIFYVGNRILKGFEIDKDIKLIKTELEDENPDRLRGSASAYASNFNYQELKDKYASKNKVANVKIE